MSTSAVRTLTRSLARKGWLLERCVLESESLSVSSRQWQSLRVNVRASSTFSSKILPANRDHDKALNCQKMSIRTAQEEVAVDAHRESEHPLYYPPAPRNGLPWNVSGMEKYEELRRLAEEDFEGFWADLARQKIQWTRPFDRVLDESEAPFYRWFEGGMLNASVQCLDRHVEAGHGDRPAIFFEGELGDSRVLTYKELLSEVNRLANVLKNRFGITKGDRVVLYMPMVPETTISILACGRLGAIQSVVFGGFSDEALRDRIASCGAKLVITADGSYRKGKPYMLKPAVDLALTHEAGKPDTSCVQNVLVLERNKVVVHEVPGRDHDWDELVPLESDVCEPTPVESDHPMFVMYTSGSTGAPKGVQHSTAGYLLWAQTAVEWIFDVKPNHGDVMWCTGDLGWIMGQTCACYGPLALGVPLVMYEGFPTYPDAGRYWRIIEKYKVTQFYTAPTAIRLLAKEGPDEPDKYDISSLRVLGSAGEPIQPAAWEWFFRRVGREQCPVVDNWWQTETGGPFLSPLPGATPLKPGSATFPLPGMFAEILDELGHRVGPNQQGLLCITRPWPSMIRTIWGNPDRYVHSYFDQIHSPDGNKKIFFTGDGAMYDNDGYMWVTGRVDDVINTCGHRLGTAEIEAAICHSPYVAEAAVVSRPDAIKGEAICAFVVARTADGVQHEDAEVRKDITRAIDHTIGHIARAERIVLVPSLPKTRSGKIVRRLLRCIARGEAIKQDVSTLEDPAVIEKIISQFQQ